MHTIIKLVGAVILGLAVSACSKNESSDKGTIGIAMPSKAEARWVSDGSKKPLIRLLMIQMCTDVL